MQKYIVRNSLGFSRGGLISCPVPSEDFHLADGHRPLASQCITIGGATILHAMVGKIEPNGAKELSLYPGKYNAARRVFGSTGHLQSPDYALSIPNPTFGISAITLRDYDILVDYSSGSSGLCGLLDGKGISLASDRSAAALIQNGPVWAAVQGTTQVTGETVASITSEVRVYSGSPTIEVVIGCSNASAGFFVTVPGHPASACEIPHFTGPHSQGFAMTAGGEAVCWIAMDSTCTVSTETHQLLLPLIKDSTNLWMRIIPVSEHLDTQFHDWCEAQFRPLAVEEVV